MRKHTFFAETVGSFFIIRALGNELRTYKTGPRHNYFQG